MQSVLQTTVTRNVESFYMNRTCFTHQLHTKTLEQSVP